MNSKIKYFVLILCLCITGGIYSVSAQSTDNNKILVEGKKPLKQSDVDGLIEFYEWAFETKFTDAQREKFQTLTINDYRKDSATNRKSTDDLLGVYAKIKAADEDRRQRTRENFVPGFVDELRRTSNEEGSKLLLSVYEAAHGEKSSTQNDSAAVADISSNNSNETRIQKDANLKDLLGKWANGRTGSTIRDMYGKTIAGNASRFTYEFFPDGTVQYTGIMHTSSLAGCRLEAFTTKKGKVSTSGNTMTIAFAPASFSRDDTCTPAQNYKKTLPAETVTLQWQIKHEPYGRTLFCTTEKGEESCFDRAVN
jgi:hypothetical protein